jgi:hypothetical protein
LIRICRKPYIISPPLPSKYLKREMPTTTTSNNVKLSDVYIELIKSWNLPIGHPEDPKSIQIGVWAREN